MGIRSKLLLTLIFLCASVSSRASDGVRNESAVSRRDTLRVEVALTGSGASNDAVRPLWSYSQEWGRYTQYKQWEGNIYSKISYHWQNRRNWFSVNVGAALEADTDKSLMMLHEAYVSGKIWEIGYSFGKEAYTPIDQRSGLGMGTYLMSDNARPLLRGGVGFFDYWAIPGIKNWIEIKGALFFGTLPDEGVAEYTKEVLLHEKFAYLRIGHFPVKPYVGLVHSVMMGGTLPNGDKMPIDFWASFFGKGSEKLKEAGYSGEYYNAAGGHQGMWDLGLDFDFEPVSGSVYYQRPFYDVTASNLFQFAKCQDFTVGAYFKIKKFKPIREVCFEYMTTYWQGGNGPADPVFISTGPERTGEVIYLCCNEVTPEQLRKYVSDDWISDWESRNGELTQGNCFNLMTEVQFYGRGNTPEGEPWTWGNRSPYLENYCYPQGWTAYGLSFGSPMFLTGTTMSAIAPGYDFFRRFSNVRMQAYNIGVRGDITENLDYRLKFTVTNNFGSLTEQYYSGIIFDQLRPNYYFSRNLMEYYSGLWLNYHFRSFTFSAALACDFGDMYTCFSGRLGVSMALDAFAKIFNKK